MRTQETYLMRVTHFARYFKKLPDKLGKKEVREYFLHLVRGQTRILRVLNMTYCALKFIYSITLERPGEVEKIPRAKRPVKMPANPLEGGSAETPCRHGQSQAQGHARDDLRIGPSHQRGGPSHGRRHR